MKLEGYKTKGWFLEDKDKNKDEDEYKIPDDTLPIQSLEWDEEIKENIGLKVLTKNK